MKLIVGFEEFPEYSNQNFRTHLNYLKCLNKLSKNLSLEVKRKIKTKNFDFKNNKNFQKRLSLIRILKESLDQEWKNTENIRELSEVNNTWIAAKSYYLFFHLLCVLESLKKNNHKLIGTHHSKIHKILKEDLKFKYLVFSEEHFNEIYSLVEVSKFKTKSGYNLRRNFEINEMKKMLLKKIRKYRLESFQRKEKINNFLKKENQKKKKEFELKETCCLLEFFYAYRIKANYKDLDYLDKELSTEEHFEYYKNYYGLIINVYNALKEVINDLYHKRCENKRIIK